MAECRICHRTLSRPADLKRHSKTHVVTDREALMHHCPEPGCGFMTLQRSNLKTHHRIHTGEKNQTCPSCSFKTSDPATLTRHRKKEHEYVPPPRRQAPRTQASSSHPPSELSTSTQSLPAEPVKELPMAPQPFLVKIPVLEQGNIVSAPLPTTLQNASLLDPLAYPKPPIPGQSAPQLAIPTLEQYPTISEPAYVANGQAFPYHARTDTFHSSTPFYQPQHPSTVCASIGGYSQHLAIQDSWPYNAMFYDPVLQNYPQGDYTLPYQELN